MSQVAVVSNPVIIESQEQAAKAFSVANLIMHPFAMERVERYAIKMAQSKAMLPACFHNNQSACEALIIQAASLGMNPEAIGRHAFLAPNGTINFEAKVFQAIGEIGAGIEFEDEYFGDWSKVIGKNIDRKTPQPDEEGLGIVITGTWYKNGEKRTKTLRVLMAQCMPRLSTNWKNDPQLQTYYASIKKFLRKYHPAATMGIFDRDDLEHQAGTRQEKDVTPTQQQEDELAAIIGGSDAVIDAEYVEGQCIDEGVESEPEFVPPTYAEEAAQYIKDSTTLAELVNVGKTIANLQSEKKINAQEVAKLQGDYKRRGAQIKAAAAQGAQQ